MSEVLMLENLKDRYIDLSKYGDDLTIKGKYEGDRIVLKNAENCKVTLDNGYIYSKHKEDAICIDGPAKNFILESTKDFLVMNGAITFWDRLENVTIDGIQRLFGHTGIRATRSLTHSNVRVRNCLIKAVMHEAMYFGPSKKTSNSSNGIWIYQNEIYLIGWDGIQVGDWLNAYIWKNDITLTGQAGMFGQWAPIMINPGSMAWVWENELVDNKRGVQGKEATVFLEKPLNFEDQ